MQASICRDDNCDRLGLHAAHDDFSDKIKRDAKERMGRLRWRPLPDGVEPPRGSRVRIKDGVRKYQKPPAAPWERIASSALDHSIAKAASKTYPKPLAMIIEEVHSDYGGCETRTIQRHLSKLVERGHLLRIDLGRRLYAYLRPGSSLAGDIGLMREQIESMYDQTAYV